jgi:hypothetical protein
MDDLICNEAVLKMFPSLTHLVAFYSAIMAGARVTSEAFYLIAHVCGTIDSRLTKWIGKIAWRAGRAVGAFGLGTSKLYLAKRYVKRD